MKIRCPKWCKVSLPEGAIVVIAASVAGLFAGFGTFFLRSGMARIAEILGVPLRIEHINFVFFLYAFIAIFGAVFYQKMIGENLANGTGQLKDRLRNGQLAFSRSHVFSPLIGCLITVGFGGSAGGEGPCAYSGAAIGDRIGRLFHISPSMRRVLFASGAAAGIAGIFKSPIGGVFFAIEVLRIEMSVIGIVAVTCASLASFGMAYVLGGYKWNISILTDMQFIPEHFGWIALLGLACGIYSIYYTYTHDLATKWILRVKNVWVRAAVCASALGLIICVFPAMFGEGYDIVSNLVNGIEYRLLEYGPFFTDLPNLSVLLIIISVMLLLKGGIVGAVNNGGGVAGEYVPTIFAGSLLGFLFASLGNMYGLNLSVDNFALIGTAAVMAGTTKAPLMAIFIAAEVSDRYGFLLGFMLAAGIAYAVVGLHGLAKMTASSPKA